MRTIRFILFGVAAQQVAATGWTNAKSFSCPSNTDNHCNSDQQRGFDWRDTPSGQDLQQYGGFEFAGFTCVDSFLSKRDALTPRTFQDKCIKGSITKDASSGPKISCGSAKPFSITDLQVSTSEDIDLDLIYSYDNGDVCKHTASCSKSGSTIKNTQCGGATSVTFKLPKYVEHSSCDVGIHRVSFDCGPPRSPPSSPSTSSVLLPKPSAPVSQPSGPASIPSLSIKYSITGNLSTSIGVRTTPGSGTAPGTVPLTYSESSTPAPSPSASSSPSSDLGSTSPPSPSVSPPASSSPAVASPSSSPAVSPPASSPPVASSPTSTPLPSTPNSSPSASTPVVTPPQSSSPASSSVIPPSASSPDSSTPAASPYISSNIIPSIPVASPPSSSSAGASTPSSATPEASSSSLTSETSPVSPPLPGTTQPVVTTEIVYTTLTNCPVTNTVTSNGRQIVQSSFTVSTIRSTITSTICTKCIAPQPSTPVATSVVAPPTSPTPAPNESSTIAIAQSSGPSPVPSTPTLPILVTSTATPASESSVLPPVPSQPATTQDVVTTVIVRTTLTTCPVTNTITSGNSKVIRTTRTVSTIFSTITSTICTKCVAPPNTQAASSAPPPEQSPQSSAAPPPSASSPPPSGPAPAPSVLPKCMNTWISLTTCENNADSNCYCTNPDFTKNVQDCVSSWSADSNEIQAALSYLAGICAPHVEANPGIVTNVPKTITLAPIPVATPVSSAFTGSVVTAGVITAPPAPAPVPATTISLVKTVTIPQTYPSGPSAGRPIPSSSTTSVISIQVTVPQVKFTTETAKAGATGSVDVNLAAGSPAPVPAVPTGASATLSTLATGILPTGGRKPTAQTSVTAFTDGAGRARSGIVGALVVGAVGFLVAL